MAPSIRRWLANGAIVLGALFFLVLGLGNHLHLVSARKLVESGAQAEGVITERIGRKNSSHFDFHYRFSVSGRGAAGLGDRADASPRLARYATSAPGK